MFMNFIIKYLFIFILMLFAFFAYAIQYCFKQRVFGWYFFGIMSVISCVISLIFFGFLTVDLGMLIFAL